MNMLRMIVAAGAASASLLAAPVYGSVGQMATLIVSDGKLTGAKGVSVGGKLYDVAFKDGSCAALFGGCDAPSDFQFSTVASAQEAVQALFNQVLIDDPQSGSFGARPELTFGCIYITSCVVKVPFAIEPGLVSYAAALNYMGSPLDEVEIEKFPIMLDTGIFGNRTYAVFSPAAAAAVPEPATWALMIGGLGMAGSAMRSTGRKPKAAVTFA